MKTSKARQLLTSVSLMSLISVAGFANASSADAWTSAGVLGSVSSITNTNLTLFEVGSSAPIETVVNPTTIFGGICHHCGQFQPFKLVDGSKICNMCGCGEPNLECIGWEHFKSYDAANVLSSLPEGTGIRVVFNTAGNSASGIKDLYINRRQALVPVSGITTITSAALLNLLKPIGVSSAALVNGGSLLQLNLKNDWTVKSEEQLNTLLAKDGGKVLPLAPAASK